MENNRKGKAKNHYSKKVITDEFDEMKENTDMYGGDWSQDLNFQKKVSFKNPKKSSGKFPRKNVRKNKIRKKKVVVHVVDHTPYPFGRMPEAKDPDFSDSEINSDFESDFDESTDEENDGKEIL